MATSRRASLGTQELDYLTQNTQLKDRHSDPKSKIPFGNSTFSQYQNRNFFSRLLLIIKTKGQSKSYHLHFGCIFHLEWISIKSPYLPRSTTTTAWKASIGLKTSRIKILHISSQFDYMDFFKPDFYNTKIAFQCIVHIAMCTFKLISFAEKDLMLVI